MRGLVAICLGLVMVLLGGSLVFVSVAWATGGIEVEKTGSLDLGGNGSANAGDLINYTFKVTNTGGGDLTNVSVTDPMVSPVTCPSGNPIPSLPVSAMETCTGSYAITQADIDAGQKDNTATAEGNSPAGNVVMDQDGHSEPIPKPIGGSCTDTSQCGAGLICIEGICISVPAAAPTASPYGIAALLLALGGFGAWRLRKRAAA